jgi:hypothetical protein
VEDQHQTLRLYFVIVIFNYIASALATQSIYDGQYWILDNLSEMPMSVPGVVKLPLLLLSLSVRFSFEVNPPPQPSPIILREGLNKDINKFGGIFHGGLTPFCRKLLRIFLYFLNFINSF